MHQEENSFLKHNVPDEILEKIISFVPSKKNCFLVSKTFHRESNNAARRKCYLKIDEDNIGCEDFMNIQRAFTDVIWQGVPEPDIDVFVTRGKKFFEKFGSQIELLLMSGINIKKSVFLEVLSHMPNLVEVRMRRCVITDDDSEPSQVFATPELSKLKKLTLIDSRVSIELFGNISIQYFDFHAAEIDLKFIHQWKHLKDVKVFCKSIDIQSLKHLCQANLKNLSLWTSVIETSQVAALIEAQPQLTFLSIMSVNNLEKVEVLRQIVKLQHLQGLNIGITPDIPIPEQLIRDIMQMPKLKKLNLAAISIDIFKAFFATKNLQLESLTIILLIPRQLLQPHELQLHELRTLAISNAFPNLKYLEVFGFYGNLDCFSRLRKLKTLNIRSHHFNDINDNGADLEVNESVRELKAHFWPSALGKIIRMMPNIEKLHIYVRNNEYPLNIASAKTLFNEVLNLRNLVEISSEPKLLLNEGIVDCINNGAGSSKIQRITFYQRVEWQAVVLAYEKQFPFKHVNFETETVTLSRF